MATSSGRKHAGPGPASDEPPVPEPTFAERRRTLVHLGQDRRSLCFEHIVDLNVRGRDRDRAVEWSPALEFLDEILSFSIAYSAQVEFETDGIKQR